MGIESPIMLDSTGKPFDKIFEMPNGCLCCSVKDELFRVIEFFANDSQFNIDYILIEANGLADISKVY